MRNIMIFAAIMIGAGTFMAQMAQRLLDYRHVLERGLMAGRFIRWFEDGHSSI